MSYENSITVEITAPGKNKPFLNIRQFLEAGYKINYPYPTPEFKMHGNSDEERFFNYIKGDLDLYKISNGNKFLTANKPGDSWDTDPGMKTYFESLVHQKVATWDRTSNNALKFLAEVFMPSKSCFIAASFRRTAYYSEYRLHDAETMGKIRNNLEEFGIPLFWRKLLKVRQILFPRTVTATLPQLESEVQDEFKAGLISLEHLSGVLAVCGMLLVMGGAAFGYESRKFIIKIVMQVNCCL